MGWKLSRRALLISASSAALSTPAFAARSTRAEPFPLSAVRLKPSIYLAHIDANRAYLMSLEPDRLLHNFRTGAGLQAKGERYGGWEGRGIAGHTLGHYLSACALLYAQTGDEEALRRVRYIVSELAECQAARGAGYVGATTVERNGQEVDGAIVYDEIRAGQIDPNPFGLNGGWVPIYSWHKVHAGLLDAHQHCGDAQALTIARGMADHLLGVFAPLDEAQTQRVLVCEHGGVNETLAELHARTGDARYLALAERLCHRAVLDPLMAEQNRLPGIHANTQIPKVIGLARLHELTGAADKARGARFFWDTVARDHSYAIGGNSEREFFGEPGVIASKLTDRTCEACNTYNMLRLTRHLWSWRQDASYFDYFERAHLNHIMAHQHPQTGMKVYFMPMTPGGRRQYSTPTSLFWCCVGSGMESHAKHGESVFWQRDDTLFVNLYIPATLNWAERRARIDLDTAYPFEETINLAVREIGRARTFTMALRLPAWCNAPTLAVNGEPIAFARQDGYALVRRRWRAGDRVTLTLPMSVRAETAPDDARIFTFFSGPLVLSPDLGPASERLTTPAPALRPTTAASDLMPLGAPHTFRLPAHAGALTMRPFFALYDRRTAPYLKQLSNEEWAARTHTFAQEERARAALDARTIDVVQLGEFDSEAAHNYRGHNDDLFSWESVRGRQAGWGAGNYFEADLATGPGPLVLRALYGGEEINKDFEVKIDGAVLAPERRPGPPQPGLVAQDYALPAALTRGKAKITVRFETRGTDAMVYELRLLRA